MLFEKNRSELSPADLELLAEAERATHLSYAPYSSFRVGAALLTSEGNIVHGANQENASFPMCMCGERVAVYHYAMRYMDEIIDAIAIRVSNKTRDAVAAAPCGACLQVLSEYESRQASPIRLLLEGDRGAIVDIPAVAAALPVRFDGDFLRHP